MMTKLLEQAIAAVRKLPPEDQDEAAEVLLWAIEARSGSIPLDEETIAAIEEGLAQARRGEFATDEEVADLWKRHGV
jgi:predicted transcriptional regulator